MKNKELLVLFGSANLNGYTNSLVENITKDIKDNENINYKRINLFKYDINNCIGCNKCNEKKFDCIFNDDMINIYEKIENADIVILATPIYFNSMTSIMKTMVDRCQRFFNMKVNNKIDFKKKKGYLLSTAGSVDKNSFDAIVNICEYFFLSINSSFEKKLFINNTDNFSKEEIEKKYYKEISEIKNSLYNLSKDN